MAKKVGSVYTEIRARLDKYERDLAKAQGKTVKSANKMQGRFNRLNFDKASKSLTKFIGIFAGVAGLKAFTSFLSDTISLQAEWERRLLRTEALLKSTGMAAGISADELAQFARELDVSTLFDKKGILDAINVMQTFRKISGETFKQAIRLSTDLAEINQTSVRASAMQIAKVLEAPGRLLSSLSRSGVIFTKAEEKMIKALEGSNRLLEAQAIIIKKLQRDLGGAAKGAAGGLAGKIDELSFRWLEFKESLSATDTAVKGIGMISTALTDLTEKIKSGELSKLAEDLFYKFTPLGKGLAGFEMLKNAWIDYWEFFRDFEKGIVRKKMPQQPEVLTFKMPKNPKDYQSSESSELPIVSSSKTKKELDKIDKDLESFFSDIDKKSAASFIEKQSLVSKDINEDLESFFSDIDKKIIEQKSLLSKAINEDLTSFFGDIDKQDVYAEKLIELSERTAYAMQANFSDLFFNIMQGKFTNLKDFATGIFASISRAAADMLGQFAVEALFGNLTKVTGGGALNNLFRPNAGGITSAPLNDFSFNNGGHLGEGVIGVGKKTGQSYEFHPNETVIPDNKMGGGANVVINFKNESGVPMTAEQSPIRFDHEKMITDIVIKRKIQSRGFRDALRA